MAQWHFEKLTPGQKTREAMQGEFFATQAIRDPAEALVREALQNSLDAGKRDDAGQQNDTVRIRLHLGTADTAALQEFFMGAWPHFQAEGNGLKDAPEASEPCRFLIVEDFGTSGLVGDVQQWEDEPGSKNAFYYFFRAEGRTGKSEDDRGRWGIGKYVFPRSSRVNSFLGFTVRNTDSERLLMGQAVLRTHKCEGSSYTPDGGFGERRDDGLLLPSRESHLIERFRDTFQVERNTEPGLSIVVPWVDAEVNYQNLLHAVIRGYFYPILEGKLEVMVSDSGREAILDADSLMDVVGKAGKDLASEMLPLIELGEWASTVKPSEYFLLNMAPNRPVWSSDLIPTTMVQNLQSRIDSGERVAIRVPLLVRAHSQADRESYFDLFFVRDGTSDDRTVFVREGIIISDVRAKRARGTRSLVVVEHRPLATLLGDSENPAHTDWQSRSANFKGKYINGKSYLDFVTHCISAIENILSFHQKEEDVDLLKDYFSLPLPPSPDSAKTQQKKPRTPKGKEPAPDLPIPEPRKKRYRLERVAGGFRLCSGEPEAELPKQIEIQAAYDVRRGNALKKYNPADFDFGSKDFRFDPPPVGVEIMRRKKNRISLKIVEKEFRIAVVGFDINRDVLVNVRVKEVEDAAQI